MDNIIKDMYLSGSSITNISKIIGVDRRSIYRTLEKEKIELRVRNTQTCFICKSPCKKNLCGTCNTNLRRYRAKLKAIEFLGGECNRCEWSGVNCGYDIHHVDRKLKTFEPTATNLARFSWDIVKKELQNCELLCALCHRLEHSKHEDLRFQEALKIYSGKK